MAEAATDPCFAPDPQAPGSGRLAQALSHHSRIHPVATAVQAGAARIRGTRIRQLRAMC